MDVPCKVFQNKEDFFFFYLEFHKTVYDAIDRKTTWVKVEKDFGLPESHYTDVWRETMRHRETENTTECT